MSDTTPSRSKEAGKKSDNPHKKLEASDKSSAEVRKKSEESRQESDLSQVMKHGPAYS
jgi:hypothetical protein